MYQNITSALACIIESYGFQVLRNGEGHCIFWGLYSQGSGVAFNARVHDWPKVWKHMHTQDRLDAAARLSGAVDEDDLRMTVRHTGRDCHARSMDVEVEGPSESDDNQADVDAVTATVTSVKEIVEKASEECHSLLEDYFLLGGDSKHVIAHETKHFRVEVRQVADDTDETLEWELEGFSDQEAVERMRDLTRNTGEYMAGVWQIRIEHRDDVEDDWEEVAECTYPAFPYRVADSVAEFRGLRNEVADAIKQARETLGITKTKSTHVLKEAA